MTWGPVLPLRVTSLLQDFTPSQSVQVSGSSRSPGTACVAQSLVPASSSLCPVLVGWKAGQRAPRETQASLSNRTGRGEWVEHKGRACSVPWFFLPGPSEEAGMRIDFLTPPCSALSGMSL